MQKHKPMWLGNFGSIIVTENATKLIPGARPFKSPSYPGGPKKRELDQLEVRKQLKSGVFETTYYESSAPVLFGNKKDGKLQFCIDYRKLTEASVKYSS